jgi:pyridoxal phosphate enzyme (YggS family)
MIKNNLSFLRQQLPAHLKLVCVSKFQDKQAILEAYEAGERIFGESRVQELQVKAETLPSDIKWHFIGHLQTNKVKNIVSFISLIHGVDSVRLLSEIDKQAAKVNRRINCLLQVHIAEEDTKFGFSSQELHDFINSNELDSYMHVNICGLMGMATFTDCTVQVRREFKGLKALFDDIKTKHAIQLPDFKELSMGMSDDYLLAIEEGSTMVRIGSKIFGQRMYL